MCLYVGRRELHTRYIEFCFLFTVPDGQKSVATLI
jgi:hypothetical protein